VLGSLATRAVIGNARVCATEWAPSPKWVFVVRALVTVKGTGAANDEM